MNKLSINKLSSKINNDYIAGLFHADGTFTVSVIKGKNKLYLNPRLIFTQDEKSLNIINEMKTKLNNLGNIKYQSNNICKYTITNLHDIKESILPIFDKYTVRSNKYSSYLKFKLLVNILYIEKPIYNSSLWLFCIYLSTKINPLVKNTTQLRHLDKNQQNVILNNELPLNINYQLLIDNYCPELVNIDNIINNVNIKTLNPITKDFINGLIDGDGSLSMSIKLSSNKYKLYLTFELIQDIFNESVLFEVKEYFDNIGIIKKHKSQRSVSLFIYSTIDMRNKIISKLLTDLNNIELITGPKIKLYKFYNFIKIMEILDNNKLKDKLILEKVLKLVYDSFTNPKEITLEEFKNRFKI